MDKPANPDPFDVGPDPSTQPSGPDGHEPPRDESSGAASHESGAGADPLGPPPGPINDPPPPVPPPPAADDADAYRLSSDPAPEPSDLPPEPAAGSAPPPTDEPLPVIDETARLRTTQRHQALAAGLLALPNLYVRSAGTILLLYGLLGLVLIALSTLGFLSGAGALLLGVAFAAIQFLLAPWIMDLSLRWLYRMSWVMPEELPEHLRQFVRRVCDRQRLKFPTFGVIDDGAPQAFTYGHHPGNARVVISRGLMTILEPDELEAVVAHELGHVRNWDMVLMTVAQLVPLVLYYLYDVARRAAVNKNSSQSAAKGRGAAAAVQVGAYVLYVVSQYVVLWFSRTREYYADRFAGQATGNPNALARGLVKIAYGLAAYNPGGGSQVAGDAVNEGQESPPMSMSKRRIAGAGATGALGALNIFDRGSAVNLVVCSAHQGNPQRAGGPAVLLGEPLAGESSTAGDSAQTAAIDIELVKGAMQWDLWNPWAGWFELHSTHPLVAKRLHYLADQAAAQGQQPWVVFDRQKPESYWDEFLEDVAVQALPAIGLLAGVLLFFLRSAADGAWQWQWLGVAAALAGVGLFFRTRFAYRSDLFPHTTVASLMNQVKVSPVRPVPATLTGQIIGKGVPGLIFSDDFVLRDPSGILFLDYNQPLAIWNFLFGLLRAGDYQGHEVLVRGWFRRAPVPYLEIYQLEPADGSLPARTCYARTASQIFSYALMVGGLAAGAVLLIV